VVGFLTTVPRAKTPKKAAKPAAKRRAAKPAPLQLARPTSDGSKARDEGVHELTWTAFDGLVRELVGKLGRFKPDLVIGIVKGGLFVGSAVAGLLRCEFVPVRLAKRSRDHNTLPTEVRTTIPPEVKGRRVLIVDDVMASGETLKRALALSTRAGAREVRSATLVIHRQKPKAAGKRPDWFALETDDLVVFPWDYELRGSGPAPTGTDADPEIFGA
jgi:hypoxanthine phosphoribosyltransferase